MPGDGAASDREFRRARIGILLPFIMLAILVGIWTIGWFVAVDRATTMLDRALAMEAAQGRTWTCRQRRTSGYPFRIEVSCQDPEFRRISALGAMSSALTRITAVAQVFRPQHIIIKVVGPLAVETDSGLRADIGWQALRASIVSEAATIDRISLSVEAPIVTVRTIIPGFHVQTRATRLEVHTRRTPGVPAPEHSYDTVIEIREVQGLPLRVNQDANQPLTLEAHFRTTRLDVLREESPVAALEAWRLAHGIIDVVLVRAAAGGDDIRARGKIGLDTSKRLEGQLVLDVSKAGALGKTLGLPQVVTALPEVTIRMVAGRLLIGPVPVGRLAPLY